jgi:hypothetical protein
VNALALPPALSRGALESGFLLAVLVLGYAVLWALWHFWFRDAGKDDGEEPSAGLEDTGERGR